MIRLLLLLALPVLAQEPQLGRGAEVFRTTCAVPYCHGAIGTAGRAPKLIGHQYSANALFEIIAHGIPNTGMPGFGGHLKTEDIEAVVTYLITLKGAGKTADTDKPSAAVVPPDVRKGRDLFFDAARMGGCGACHELQERGVPIGPGLSALKPQQLQNLRPGPKSSTVTARTTGGEEFPALVVEQTAQRIRIYDLSSPLPVLRSFTPSQIALVPGSAWQHQDATRLYSDEQLETIAGYLKWLADKRTD